MEVVWPGLRRCGDRECEFRDMRGEASWVIAGRGSVRGISADTGPDPARKFLGWVGPDLCERGMIVGKGGELSRRHPHGHRRNDLVNQFATQGTGTACPKDFPGIRGGQQLREAVLGIHDNGLTVVSEGIGGAEVGLAGGMSRLFRQADGGDLGICEDDVDQETHVHSLNRSGMGQIVRGDFPLTDGDVHDFVEARAIACRIDV